MSFWRTGKLEGRDDAKIYFSSTFNMFEYFLACPLELPLKIKMDLHS